MLLWWLSVTVLTVSIVVELWLKWSGKLFFFDIIVACKHQLFSFSSNEINFVITCSASCGHAINKQATLTCCSILPVCCHCGLCSSTVFLDYFIKGMIFRKQFLNIKCVLILSTKFSKTLLILRRIDRHIPINVHRSTCEVLNFLSHFKRNLIFLTYFLIILKYLSWKSVQLGHSCSMRTEGRKDGET